jgi:transposase
MDVVEQIRRLQYCRKKGLLAEQIELWKLACMGANANVAEQKKVHKGQSKKDKTRIKQLEVELRRKERALA